MTLLEAAYQAAWKMKLTPRQRLAFEERVLQKRAEMDRESNPTASPVPRPDVEGIQAKYAEMPKSYAPERYGELVFLATEIPALIAYIEALEARQVKLEAVVGEVRRYKNTWYSPSVLKALAALGDGDG